MFQNVGLIVQAPVHPITQVKTPLTIVFVVPHQAHLLPMITYITIAITALHKHESVYYVCGSIYTCICPHWLAIIDIQNKKHIGKQLLRAYCNTIMITRLHSLRTQNYRIWVEAVDMDRSKGKTPFAVRLTKNGQSEDKQFEDIQEDDEVPVFEFTL
eukprot:COSAG05_NODE_4272_length_1588_cov_1.354600_2_plen_157_part_00